MLGVIPCSRAISDLPSQYALRAGLRVALTVTTTPGEPECGE